MGEWRTYFIDHMSVLLTNSQYGTPHYGSLPHVLSHIKGLNQLSYHRTQRSCVPSMAMIMINVLAHVENMCVYSRMVDSGLFKLHEWHNCMHCISGS